MFADKDGCSSSSSGSEITQQHQNSPEMASPSFSQKDNNTIPIIASLVVFLLLLASSEAKNSTATTFRPARDLHKLRMIRAHLGKINKPSLKTIQSLDGDTIDCVPSHLQPAFDHPKLKGQKPLDPPERPKSNESLSMAEMAAESLQLWRDSGEFCPEGTVPIRRTNEKDMLRASSLRRFGRKPVRGVRRDSSGGGHEHAVGYVSGDQYYGAKASLNVWAPRVTSPSEFSLSQLWVISGSFGRDLNTIEAGWQISPQLYGDNLPRFFTYWTTDAYQETGCYNLLCSGFVQTNNKIAIGAAISPRSAYNGGQFDISLLIWKQVCSLCSPDHPSCPFRVMDGSDDSPLTANRGPNGGAYLWLYLSCPSHEMISSDRADPKHGHWWLEFGSGLLIGYWPVFLFSHLARHASMVQFGGEIVNSRPSGFHTSTQMGSGHFANEGFRRAAYFRNLQVVDWDNNLIPLSNFRLLADHSSCYSIQGGVNRVWGNYFYFGGPGRCLRCP